MKKILILGGNYVEQEIVNRAKFLGYYTIVTDNHEDWSLSPAKQIADEGWNVSWSDIDKLETLCRKKCVNGVIAGFSEFRVEAMIKLTERLGLPCSLNISQLEITRNKILFKETCRKYNVPTVTEYTFNAVSQYPVIIKPVDRAGSIGINVAYNHDDLVKFYDYAINLSPTKQVIIEDFITDGIKFDVYYYVKGDNVTFLGSSDTIMCKGTDGAKILQKCWPFKSKFENLYRKQTEANVISMLRGLNINNAYATMSAFFQNGHFYFFEAGFRLSGEMSFNYYEAANKQNYLDEVLQFAMNDTTDEVMYDVHSDSINCAVLNFFVKDGKVKYLKGINMLETNDAVKNTKLYLTIDEVIHNASNVFKKGAMVTLVTDSAQKLQDAILWTNDTFDIIGEDGNSMIYEKVNKCELNEYYK